MSDIGSIGVSALLAFQRSLSTVGHNIANSTTEGFSRQRVGLSAQIPISTPSGFLGSGVRVDSITRIYDQFVVDRLQTNTSNYNEAEQFLSLVSQVNNLLGDEFSGLSPSIQNFFNSLQDSVDDPSSGPARQIFLSDANTLVQRFQSIDERLRQVASNAESDLVNITNEINNLGAVLVRVNESIALSGTSNSGLANDLLDERDNLLRELSKLTNVTTVQQSNGALNVFIGNGQGLVVGSTASELQVVRNSFNPERFDVVISQGGTSINITEQLSGGRLGAVIDFRTNVIDPSLNALGRIAIGIAETFNEQHQLGIDLNGNNGLALFSVSPLNVAANNNNTGSGTVSAALIDVSQLTNSDYRVSYDGTNYQVIRLSDNVGIYSGGFPATIDGFELTITGAPAAGDSFLVQPTRSGARNISVLITDSSLIAHASPIRSSTALTNTGSLEFELGAVTNATTFPLGADITLAFSLDADGSGNSGFIVSNPPGGSVLYDPTTQSAGLSATLANGISLTVSGIPAVGDSITVSNNTNGIGDNRNGLLLSQLQNTVTLLGNNTFQSSFGEIIADVGVRTRQGQLNESTQLVLLQQTEAERESISGVNLDEEAARLIQLQQAYQAAARVISVANSLFEEILAAVRG